MATYKYKGFCFVEIKPARQQQAAGKEDTNKYVSSYET